MTDFPRHHAADEGTGASLASSTKDAVFSGQRGDFRGKKAPARKFGLNVKGPTASMKHIVCIAIALGVGSGVLAQAPGQPGQPAQPGQAPAAPGAAPAAPAAAPQDLNLEAATERLFTEAFNSFQEGKFDDALAKVAEINKNVNNKPFEKVLFLEGACYFNKEDYAKAAEAFQKYVDTFPDGTNIIDVRMGLGRSCLKKGDAAKGIEVLKKVVTDSPERKGEAGLVIATHLKAENKVDEALEILKSVAQDGVRSAEGVQAALMASELFIAKGDVENAQKYADSVKAIATEGDSVVQVNNISLKLGDKLMEEKNFPQALNAYQMVRRKSEISRLQKTQIADLEAKLKTVGQPRGLPAARKEEFENKLKAQNELLAELEKRTDYDASLYYRLGRCFFEMGAPPPGSEKQGDPSRLWQAIVAFDKIIQDFKEFPQRDKVMYGTIMANVALKRVDKARELCEKFITDFPASDVLPQISEMYYMMLYQNGKVAEAVDAAEKTLGFPKVDKERTLYLKGNMQFELQRFGEALTTFEILLKDYAQSVYKDEVQYRIALAYFYQNDYKNVMKSLKAYIADNPKGQFVADAKYRMAFIRFQGKEVDGAMEDLHKIIEESPNDQNIGQVHALLADAYNQKGDGAKAMEHYAIAVDKAKTEDVLKYTMDNLTDLYVGENKWKELAAMWSKYYETHKDNEDQALKAIYWITRALVRDAPPEGTSKEDAEKFKQANLGKAKKMLGEAIVPKIGNAANEQVEVLIQQLCSMMAPKRRRPASSPAPAPAADAAKPADGAAPAATAAATPAPEAPPPAPAGPTFEEVEKELEGLISPPETAMNGTAQMRILFARAWLARMMREAEKAEKVFAVIIEVAKPDDLSPLLLSTVGDNARNKGDLAKAEACYKRLMEIFPQSEFADAAPVGLAEIAYGKGEYDKALQLFEEATGEKYQGSSRILDANLGKAKTLFQLKKFDGDNGAFKLYETIAQTKEWRGEATAESLFMMGEIEKVRGKPALAIPYYQRVFIAHQKWKKWVAKAYVECAKCFLLLNRPANPEETDPTKKRQYSDREAAKLLLIEMTKREDLKNETKETADAQAELSKL